jgi:Secretion system C-terminal sorting domain
MAKKLGLLIAVIFLFLSCSSQGINKGIYFGQISSAFQALKVVDDTIFICGIRIDTNHHQTPFICTVALDGNEISSTEFNINNYRNYSGGVGLHDYNNHFIFSEGSALNGSPFYTGGFIGITDRNLTPIDYLDYQDTALRSIHITRTFATSDSTYLALATDQKMDYNANVVCYLLDRNLNIISKKTYFSPAGDYCEDAINLIKMADDSFMLCAFQSPCVGHVEVSNTMLVKIHANGDTMSSWVDPGEDSMDIFDLFRLPDGGYICGGIKLDSINGLDNTRYYDAFIARLDANYSRTWLRRTGWVYSYDVSVNRVLPYDSLTFLAVGQDWETPLPRPTVCGYKIAFIEKRQVSDGSLIWRRNYKNLADTSCYPVGGRWDENKLHDITILPDHSIVACGEFINWADTSHPQQGWLIKVNEYGCFSADCSDTTWMNFVSTIPSQNIKMSIFPNPASDQVAVEIINRGNEINDAALSVYDMSGQLVHSYAHINTQTTYFLSIKNYAAGNYILRLESRGILLGSSKLVKE